MAMIWTCASQWWSILVRMWERCASLADSITQLPYLSIYDEVTRRMIQHLILLVLVPICMFHIYPSCRQMNSISNKLPLFFLVHIHMHIICLVYLLWKLHLSSNHWDKWEKWYGSTSQSICESLVFNAALSFYVNFGKYFISMTTFWGNIYETFWFCPLSFGSK